MITDALLTIVTAPLVLLLSAIPHFTEPSWLSDGSLASNASALGSQMSGFAYWIPWGALLQVTATVFTVFALVVSARLGLWLWSKLPVIGGGS